MAYNPFPVGYQPSQFYYQQQQPQSLTIQPQPTQQNNGIIWVQGEAGAKSYLVAPNTTVQLWDSESQIIYLKSADASGMPSMKIIDYTIRDVGTSHTQPAEKNSNYATKEELGALQVEINKLREEINKQDKKGDF